MNDNNNNSSILEKIIFSKKSSDIEQFNPTEVVSLLLKNLASREEDVLRRRHGLMGKEKETLENIGTSYKVTRERIRQIENTALSKIRKSRNFKEITEPIENTIYSVLQQHGGTMSENSLLISLLQAVGDSQINRQNILFIIGELLKAKFKSLKSSQDFKKSWQISHTPMHLLKETMGELLKIIQDQGSPLAIDEILKMIKNSDFFNKNQSQLSDEILISYLDISPRISKNPFDEYGLTEWGSIVPKRMNDKIYLILKKHKKPMHFTEIAQKINEARFDKRKAYPPTVHNELILNKQYVLVGRGIYALKEWGYKSGVVLNVLIDIIKKSENPLTRDELVEQVLKQRIVKKNTIHLALTDKSKFQKHSGGTYTLIES